MNDKFEKFISENREAFDIHEPDPKIWDRIEKNTRPVRKLNWKKILYQAAAVVIIFLASYMVHDLVQKPPKDSVAKEKKQELEIPELMEAEIYYTSILNNKLEEIKPILAGDPGLQKELNIELSELDSIYRDLKQDLQDNIANNEVIEAMIQNYRFRVAILEDILSQLKSEEDTSKQKINRYEI
ncbi:MAG: hypothetical protein JXJ22_02455 [Bacteroidales bacterium]|nr:hypothetical protein [Bacteroidales bacterium]